MKRKRALFGGLVLIASVVLGLAVSASRKTSKQLDSEPGYDGELDYTSGIGATV